MQTQRVYADDMIWPFSYAAATEGNGEPFMGYIGTVEELKAMLKERCQTAVVSDALMNLAVANGVWQYSFLLEDQGFSMSELRGGTTGGDAMSEKSEPDAGLTICRDNRGLLENLLSCAPHPLFGLAHLPVADECTPCCFPQLFQLSRQVDSTRPCSMLITHLYALRVLMAAVDKAISRTPA